KTIAELLLNDINNHRGWFEEKVETPPNQYALITWAGKVLEDGLTATINKNSLFYIQLKQEKARRDFEFATGKVDSLRNVMNSKDNQLIEIDKRTLFTNTNKLEFRVPTENLIADKQMI